MNKKFITTYKELKSSLKLSADEEKYWSGSIKNNLPFRMTSYWMAQIKKSPHDIFRKQSIPNVSELDSDNNGLLDPLGDTLHSPVEGLVHHYGDRALVLITDQCALYCRHCFRRHHTGNKGSLTFKQIDRIMDYLEDHSEIHEIIISGGDSLFAPLDVLSYLLFSLKECAQTRVVRLATRLPVTAPHLINMQRLEILRSYPMLWLVTQINHSCEMTDEVLTAFSFIQEQGIPILNQSVLLKGINDDSETLKELCYKLIENKIKPYYLFQCDLAMGTKHFRVPLDRALEIYGKLKSQISHMALPRFALDLPGGVGKVNLDDMSVQSGMDSEYFYFTTITGEKGRYPRENDNE